MSLQMGASATFQDSRISQEIEEQKGKPRDGSDIIDLNQARDEIVKIRGYIHSLQTQRTQSPRNQPEIPKVSISR